MKFDVSQSTILSASRQAKPGPPLAERILWVFHLVVILSLCILPAFGLAAEKNAALRDVYRTRPDLQAAFDSASWQAVSGSAAGFLIDLEDWASQYGWREYPELSGYAPLSSRLPVRTSNATLPPVTAQAYVVVDRQSGLVLAEHASTAVWPIASLTKVMTNELVLEKGISLSSIHAIETEDEVGGARISVTPGTTYTLQDLMYASLVGSANNATNALSRATGLSQEEFVAEMNAKAKTLGLPHTSFFEPTGIEEENVSTAREYAKFALHAFGRQDLGRYTGTIVRTVTAQTDGTTKRLMNTNWMLWKPEYDDVYVTSSKTGYLEESDWNLVVSLRPSASDAREVLIVLFGAGSRAQSFVDAYALVHWAWDNHEWTERQ